MNAGDIDPAYPALLYLSSRFELNFEQRLWLAWLYASCYHVPTAYYIYNEFPDFENVDETRLGRWWQNHKHQVVFQTDRLWIKSRNQFCDSFRSYRAIIGNQTQEQYFFDLQDDNPNRFYDNCYDRLLDIKYFGRYTMFLYLEAVEALTGIGIMPASIDLRNSQSSRNGLCYVFGLDNLLCGHDYGKTTLTKGEFDMLDELFDELMVMVIEQDSIYQSNIWSVETSLCAFKKLLRGKRYIGYYIDRQHKEISQSEGLITEGVDWSVLWDFRQTHFAPEWLIECC
jgi:hypothetical protein